MAIIMNDATSTYHISPCKNIHAAMEVTNMSIGELHNSRKP